MEHSILLKSVSPPETHRLKMFKCILVAITLILLSVFSLQAQNKEVSGLVSSENGEALPGVSVAIKGTPRGTTTDVNGKYKITIENENTVLVFSFIGYSPEEITVGNQSIIDVKLLPDIQSLSEVVVVGYGSQKKTDITGSIVSVDNKVLQEVPAPNVINQLQGRVAGIDIVSNNSSPGGTNQIRIRGNRSLATTQSANDQQNAPLIVLDGIPYGGSINDISPNDIASLDILKDASATAIYGSRGSNGVILITTKKGKPGKAVMSYNAWYGVTDRIGEYKVFNGSEYAAYKEQARLGNSVNPGTTSYGLSADEQAGVTNGTSTDWQKLIYKKGYTTNHELSLNGGNENSQYSLSAGYYKEAGIIPGQNFTRYTLRTSIDHKINQKLKIGISTLNTLGYTNLGGNPVGGLVRLSPLTSPYNADGTVNQLPLKGLLDAPTVNPLSIINNTDRIVNNSRRLRTFNSLYGEWQIIKNLKYRINVGLNYAQTQAASYFGPNTFYNNSTSIAQANESVVNSEEWRYVVENLLTYDKKFLEKHQVTFTGLYSFQKDHNQSGGIFGTGLPADYIQYYNLGQANSVTAFTVANNPWSNTDRGLISYMARLNYSFDNRFLLTATVRTDGASVLSPGNQYFTYPAIGLGWNIMNENFMSNFNAVSNLKLRGGWGKTSSQSVNPYSTLGQLGTNSYNFGSGTAGQTGGYYVNFLPNKGLSWESTAQFNAGLDFGFLQNRITGSIDVYDQKTSGILLTRSLAPSFGATSTIVNAGKTKGHGIELVINSENIKSSGGFNWNTTVNFTVNREQIVELQNPSLKADVGNGWFVGQPLSVIYDVKKIGIWQTADAALAATYGRLPGQIRVEDINGAANDGKPDGKIDANDRQILGNFQPQWTGGITNNISYKGFDLSVVIFARMGMKVVVPYVMTDGGANGFPFFNNGRGNSLKRDYWTPTNATNAFPRPDAATDATPYSTTLGYQDGSFIKVRAINLGYNLPSGILSKAGVSNLRVYVTIANPFILYSPFVKAGYGPDPEGNGYGGVSTSTVGGTPVPGRAITVNMNAPSTRQFNFGVNLKF